MIGSVYAQVQAQSPAGRARTEVLMLGSAVLMSLMSGASRMAMRKFR